MLLVTLLGGRFVCFVTMQCIGVTTDTWNDASAYVRVFWRGCDMSLFYG